MSIDIRPFLEDMYPDTIRVRKRVGSANYKGGSSYGEWKPYPAIVRGQTQMITSASGKEVVSKVNAVINSHEAFTTLDDFELPSRFIPNNRPALNVEEQTDDNGPHHQVVFF